MGFFDNQENALVPMVGIVRTTSFGLYNLYRIVVLPALSSPITRMRASLPPNNEFRIPLSTMPITSCANSTQRGYKRRNASAETFTTKYPKARQRRLASVPGHWQMQKIFAVRTACCSSTANSSTPPGAEVLSQRSNRIFLPTYL